MAYNAGASSGNLILIQSQTASASANISFITGITGYDRYKLVFYNLITTGAGSLTMVWSQDGGGTYLNANYLQAGPCANTGNAFFGSNGGATSFLLTNALGNGATSALFGTLEFNTLQNTSLNKNVLGNLWDGNTGYWSLGGVNTTNTSAVNGIQIAVDAGSMTGTFQLYGVQN